MTLNSFFAQSTEPALNVTLANLLVKRGLMALGEVKIHKGKKLKKPDVMIILNSIRIILEGKFEGNRQILERQCKERLDDGLCSISIAIEYKRGPFIGNTLDEAMEKMKYASKVYWTIGETGWQESVDINDIVKLIRSAYTISVSNNIIAEAVDSLNESLDNWYNTLSFSQFVCLLIIVISLLIFIKFKRKANRDYSFTKNYE